MHGIIFLYLQRFAQRRGGPTAWNDLLREAELASKAYSPVQEYPDDEALKLMHAASRQFNSPLSQVLEDFGEFLAPGLLQLYASLIHPEWKTLEVIANTEELIHRTVRMRNPGAKPPMLECMRTDDNSIQIIYSSHRKLCSLAKGIAKGIAAHYQEEIEIVDQACMLHGDPFCAMQVIRPALGSSGSVDIEQQHAELPKPVAHSTIANPALQYQAPLKTNVVAYPFLSIPTRPDEIGTLAHYRVFRLLGQGGMGMVFHAEDLRLERPVALKVLHAQFASDPVIRQRFLREARALAILKHAHIVTVYDVGEESESPYLVMEFLEGQSLEEYRRTQPALTPAQIVEISQHIAHGLTAAHHKGVIHRDIKPTNLWMDSNSGQVKILDFGLARVGQEMTQLSEHGLVLGTPAFMAPEQADGAPVDTRADLFSLGCVMYWLCTGRSPFQGSNVMNTLAMLATKTPMSPRDYNPAIPDPLSKLTMHLLEKDPKHRPQTSREVVQALQSMEVA